MDDSIFVGREHELKMIHGAMDQKRNLILFGQDGSGKTSLMKRVIADRGPGFRLFSENSPTLKQSLINFVLYGRTGRNDISRQNILSLKKIFYPLLKEGPEYVIFDHLGRVGPKFYSFFEYLLDEGVPLLVVCRGLREADIGHLCLSLFDFEKIEMPNFDRAASVALIKRLMNLFGLEAFCRDAFVNDIYCFSKGNPKVIRDLCVLARNDNYRKNGSFDVKLMDLDRRMQFLFCDQTSDS